MNGELADISSDIATMPPAIADALRPLIEAASALGSGVLERQVTARADAETEVRRAALSCVFGSIWSTIGAPFQSRTPKSSPAIFTSRTTSVGIAPVSAFALLETGWSGRRTEPTVHRSPRR